MRVGVAGVYHNCLMLEVSDRFFGWLCGFGKDAKILKPETVADAYMEHLNTINRIYAEWHK